MNLQNNKQIYFYKIYNLNVKSEIYLPEFDYAQYEALDNIDVNILLKPCPYELHNIKVSNEYYTLTETEAMFKPKECGKFYIKNGDTIIVEPIENPNYEHLKAYIYGRAFAILLFQRNTVALHGNSIIINDKAYIFCGTSGAGKSTLSTALILKNYEMLSDDLSVINFNGNNKPEICPGVINSKLCVDTINYFNLDINNLVKVDNFANKYALPQKSKPLTTTKEISALIELNIDYENTNDTVTLEELHGEEKLQSIFKNVFRKNLITDLGLKPKYFKSCLNIAKNIKVFKLTRPLGKYTIDEQLSLLQEHF